MAKPKLALIPAAIGTKLYSVLPSNGSGDFTFTRGSAATRINAQGLIESVANTSSRLNYPLLDGKVVGCPHNLLEPQRTNVVQYSENFSSGWVLDDATIISNNAISPDGTLNATLLKGNTNSSRHNLVISGQASSTGSFSVFVKAKELKYVQIASANTVQQYVNFDLSNGIIGTVGSSFSNAKLENYGNGWYRCIVVSANQFNGFYFSLVSGLNATWLESWVMPNNTDGLYIFGAQLEVGSFPTSYIKSNIGNATTRLAEVATGAGNSTTFSDSEGVLMVEASSDDTTSVIWSVSDGSNSNAVSLYYGNGGVLSDIFSSAGTRTLLASMSIGLRPNMNKFLIKYKSTDLAIWLNGFELAVSTQTISLNGLNELKGAYGSGSFTFHGNVKQIQYFDSILDSQQLEQLTSWQSFSDMAEGQLYTIE